MEKLSKNVSMTVVRRLPKYYQYLTDLSDKGIQKISSKELANLMGLTASQIRQDLNAFGAYGQQGYGYRVAELCDAIRILLGLDRVYNCVIIGSGNLGRAISNYERFYQDGIHILGMFDIDRKKISKSTGQIPIMHVDQLDEFVRNNAVDLCILAVPREVGQSMAEKVCALGIKGILNFVPVDLTVPDNVMVENVNITDSMFVLTYNMK